ncbi:protein translocase subunit SecF [Pedococcus bigeumensis]|uniref:Protein-export membrane protein SecF n=1 Tax=Pedococcus bigeumensis TaxID=433644 RepID=A0A502CZX1_9MICO|nr:protein translocase subunit SecF [Pedococcus bigeumensis]TPG18070.1 protein translocase subunit SecF [Pedococcus bigeumensis]
MINFAALGNDLYTGKRSIDFVGRYKRWYALSGVFCAIAIIGLVWHGLNLSLEFRGGSEFRVSSVTNSTNYESRAKDAVGTIPTAGAAEVTKVGTSTIRVQTEKLNEDEIRSVQSALAGEFKTSTNDVSASFVGPSWGASVSQQALKALAVFLALVSLVMAIYFRTWKMAVAGLVALLHDLFITVGVYALAGFEVSPATMIGFLTILGYSLYDTVVVFDKVRENTNEALGNGRMTYSQAANLAVNQTLVRSINTTIVALLPIASILVIGFLYLGPGTLLDLALALFVGIAVGAYSSIFIATPLLVHLRLKEPAVADLEKKATRYQSRHGGVVSSSDAAPVPHEPDAEELAAAGSDRESVSATARSGGVVRETHKYATSGPRNQPKRPPKSRR